jgi:phage gp46-like protein
VSDIALEMDPDIGAASVVIENNDLKEDAGLRTSILESLFLDRRAEEGDVLPPGVTDRRGWWADEFADVAGDLIGSRLWLLERCKESNENLNRATQYAREALKWLVDDAVTDRVDVSVTFLSPQRGFAFAIDIYKPDRKDPVRFRFNRTWAAEGITS